MGRRLLSGISSSSAEDLPTNNLHVGSDFIAIVAAFLCALICILGVFAMARCTCLRRRSSSNSTSTSSSSHSSVAKKGADKKLIQTLPKFSYANSSCETGFVSEECAICLAKFDKGDEIRILPDCGHGFHVECIDTWLAARSSCPSCRQCLVPVRCHKCGHTPAGRKALDEAVLSCRDSLKNVSR